MTNTKQITESLADLANCINAARAASPAGLKVLDKYAAEMKRMVRALEKIECEAFAAEEAA